MTGPLASLKVVEFAGLGPAPLAGQMLADLGAEVISVDRASGPADPTDINRRGKRSIALNLKSQGGLAIAKALIDRVDVLIEGFRPGVMERFGLGPDDCPDRLVYARMTGWGQTGPWSQTAGHDINYLAMTGALQAMGSPDRPPPVPLNLIADYGGGTMFLLLGLLSALIERGVSGKGQVVDTAMVDGVPAMMGMIHGMQAQGKWRTEREANWLDGGAPFYRCYECADGKFISVGALEPRFFAELVAKADLPFADLSAQNDISLWPETRAEWATVFMSKTRDEWAALFDGSDAGVAPVLDFSEAPQHRQNKDRGVFFDNENVTQANPAPRFSRSHVPQPKPPTVIGGDGDALLQNLGYSAAQIAELRRKGEVT
ncbi:CoA transferase [Roseobacter sp. YSTF-M11]|uniref:CoA transferase n=1 Tax=Roseobacter insulae TaxID=2859783 RepID=A0A9X1JYK3_9RHOB|nr:CaiB/BaiF CoA-transferase family protein [Roseobacter insulae]MBW4708361.1 CoA transferase [Roseobacter insulae]